MQGGLDAGECRLFIKIQGSKLDILRNPQPDQTSLVTYYWTMLLW